MKRKLPSRKRSPRLFSATLGTAAGKDLRSCRARWLQRWGAQLNAWRSTVPGDDLHPQRFYEPVLAQRCAFMFVCLPDFHPLAS